MKKRILFTVLLLAGSYIATGQKSNSRVISNFDSNWKFRSGDEAGASAASYNDKQWRILNLPHNWSIEGENLQNAPGAGNVGYFPTGIGWYRKTFNFPGYSKNHMYSIEFDGVYMNSEVWINEVYLGKRPYGYSSFSYDLTPYLKASGNVIAVRVDNSAQPNSRWYTGSGIYRHVRIVQTNPVHFEKWGIFSYTGNITNENAPIHVESTILNEKGPGVKAAVIRNELFNAGGVSVGRSESLVVINANSKAKTTQELIVENPVLWSIENPYLYTLASYVYINGKETDCVLTSIGIRTIKYDAGKGFFLNEKPVKMKGVNLHHDAGAVGVAVPERVWERRLEILKEGGCNAVRTAHNPPAPEFLDLCDKLGILVMDEAFDEWLAGKREFSYKLHFAEWYEQDLNAMVLRDRNHPSVVMWSIGNEVPDQSSKEGLGLAEKMIEICHAADPTRLVTSGNDRIYADDNPATEEFLAAFANDIVGYNYPDRWHERRELYYSADKQRFPDRRVVGTESGGMGGMRGSYAGRAGFGTRTATPSNILTARFIDTE